MTCRDVMTQNPACAAVNDPVIEAARLMKQNDIGPIPIVDSRDSLRLVGIVTDRDLALKVVAEGRDPKSVRAEAVMTPDPVVCRPEDDLDRAMAAMSQHQVRRIPIVDENRRLLGIVAQADIARHEEAKKTGQVVEEISQPRKAGSS